METPSGKGSTALHSVRGSYRTVWYIIGASGEIIDATQSEVNAVVAACRANGTGGSPT